MPFEHPRPRQASSSCRDWIVCTSSPHQSTGCAPCGTRSAQVVQNRMKERVPNRFTFDCCVLLVCFAFVGRSWAAAAAATHAPTLSRAERASRPEIRGGQGRRPEQNTLADPSIQMDCSTVGNRACGDLGGAKAGRLLAVESTPANF